MDLNGHIDCKPDRCGGKPCITGSRIRVWDIYVLHERQGKSVDEIIGEYPDLTLADVHAALAYYWDHKAEIDQQMKAADGFIEQLRSLSRSGPVARKLAALDSTSDSVPS